jgi:hypothetical protein
LTTDGPDHEAFLRDLVRGQRAEVVVAVRLLCEGVPVRLDPRRNELRSDPSGYEQYGDDVDVLAGDRYRIEVKSSTYAFTCPEDWPFPWGAYLWSKPRWDVAVVKPDAYVLYSEPTGAMLAVSGHTSDEWIVRVSHDSRRNGWATEKLCAPVHLIHPFDLLVEMLVGYFGGVSTRTEAHA